jgi:hypothetical protein
MVIFTVFNPPVNRNMGVPGASSGGKTSHVNDPMLLLGVDVGEW